MIDHINGQPRVCGAGKDHKTIIGHDGGSHRPSETNVG
jgi:hypothetical protein